MPNDASKITRKKILTQELNSKKENIICKDGFCSISNHNEPSKIDNNNINFFDPI